MIQLNDAQKSAVMHREGPMLVLAGPGSGKTMVIVKRTQYLIEQCGIVPGSILVITFTKAAAVQMQDRFEQLLSMQNSMVNFGTFHAVFFKILRYAYHYTAADIISDEERYRILREIISNLQLEIEDEKEFIEGIGSEISLVKAEYMDVNHYYSMNCSEEDFQKIYKEYHKKMQSIGKIDFDDMLVLTYELFRERPDILAMWQKKYQYILVDEFQDINKLQFEIVRMLARPENNLFVVGDDDQSIYRFRGAKPEIMLSFESYYPKCQKVLLNYNYRSKKSIVKGALRVVSCNQKRFEKSILTVREEGSPIKIREFKDLAEENQAVIDAIGDLRRSGYMYQQIAVLYRTNTQPSALVNQLMAYNIPFQMRDALPNIYEHWMTQDILSYIKMALGGRDRMDLLRIMNRPKRYLRRDYLEEAQVDFTKLKRCYSDKPYVIERIEKLEYDLALLKKTNPYAAINYIRRAIGYDDYLKEYAQYRRIKVEELYDILGELQENAREFETYDLWFEHMQEYKENLQKQVLNRKQRQTEGVVLTTFHASKGLEFEAVFIVDANEGITPHKKAVVPEDIEEERRMFYVAMTRAKNLLSIYYVKQRYSKDLFCSRFVGELKCDQTQLKPGTLISHKIYGDGIIKKIENHKVTVKFEEILIPKVMDLDFCIQNQMFTIKE